LHRLQFKSIRDFTLWASPETHAKAPGDWPHEGAAGAARFIIHGMHALSQKNKTVAAWLAFIGGQLGLHRLYLYGWSDLWAWAHPIVAALGWWGVERVWMYGQDDHLAWVLIPLLGFTLAGTALTGIYYGLMTPEKWNLTHNQATPDATAGNTNWLTIGAIVFALLFGTISLMSSIAFSFQRYFEDEVEEARKLSQ